MEGSESWGSGNGSGGRPPGSKGFELALVNSGRHELESGDRTEISDSMLPTIREVKTEEDIYGLREMLGKTPIKSTTDRIIDRGSEIDEILASIRASLLKNSDHTYVVARNDQGDPVAMIGLQPVSVGVSNLIGATKSKSEKTGELVEAHVLDSYRDNGFDSALAEELIVIARRRGFTELVVKDVPSDQGQKRDRDRQTWQTTFDEPAALIRTFPDFADTVIWRKAL